MSSRTLAVFGWILLGAIAAGGSIGYFLHAANADRSYLSTRLQTTVHELERAKSGDTELVQQANQKVASTTQELVQLQKQVQAYEKERDLLTQAQTLTPPDPKALKTWIEAFSIPLGISIHLPPGAVVTDYENHLEATTAQKNSPPWLSITTYDAQQEQQLLQNLADTSTVTYLIAGNLVTGIRGNVSDGLGYVLRIIANHQPSFLVWARTDSTMTDKKIQGSLATLSLRP